MNTSGHGPKSDPNRIFEQCLAKKKLLLPKINGDRVAKDVFDLRNDFHEDRLSVSVCGEKINLGHFRPFFEARRTNSHKFLPNLGVKRWKIAMYEEYKKIGPKIICRPPRFQLMRLTLTITLFVYFRP
jgi:hypothetical protein